MKDGYRVLIQQDGDDSYTATAATVESTSTRYGWMGNFKALQELIGSLFNSAMSPDMQYKRVVDSLEIHQRYHSHAHFDLATVLESGFEAEH